MKEKEDILANYKFKYIGSIGIELEGGWLTTPGYEIHHDGSVKCTEASVKGESHTDPGDTLVKVFKSMRERYPSIVDDSCGMHVHIRLPDTYYVFLTSEKFWKYYLKRMDELHEVLKKDTKHPEDAARFMKRHSGEVTYCSKTFRPDKQIMDSSKGGHRYSSLNYCYRLHKTLECRLFPMCTSFMNAKLCVWTFVDTVETYLANCKEQMQFWSNIEVDHEEPVKEEICA